MGSVPIFLPELIHIPAVLAFLGYVPWDYPEDVIGKLRYFKKLKGLSYERLGAVMGRDAEQLEDWMSERYKPCRKNIQSIKEFLAQYK